MDPTSSYLLRLEFKVEMVLAVGQGQDLVFDQDVEYGFEGLVVETGTFLEVLVRDDISARVELEQNSCLESAADEGVLLARIRCANLVATVLPEPLELATRMLVAVKQLESLKSLGELGWELHLGCRRCQWPR